MDVKLNDLKETLKVQESSGDLWFVKPEGTCAVTSCDLLKATLNESS